MHTRNGCLLGVLLVCKQISLLPGLCTLVPDAGPCINSLGRSPNTPPKAAVLQFLVPAARTCWPQQKEWTLCNMCHGPGQPRHILLRESTFDDLFLLHCVGWKGFGIFFTKLFLKQVQFDRSSGLFAYLPRPSIASFFAAQLVLMILSSTHIGARSVAVRHSMGCQDS